MKKIIIQGIKYDEKSSYQKGPGLAPPLIREVMHCGSSNYFAENEVSIENANIVDKGDFDISEYFEIEHITEEHLKLNGRIFTLGGDHSITYPIIKAHHQKYPILDILQIDAHFDLMRSLLKATNIPMKMSICQYPSKRVCCQTCPRGWDTDIKYPPG